MDVWGRLESSSTHLITPSQNFVEVRCGLFFDVPSLASDALHITLHPLLENGVTVILKEPFLGLRRTLVERQCCAIEKWQWMRSPRSVEPH